MTTRAPRRFPPPWTIVEHSESFAVHDAKGRPIVYAYFADDPDRADLMGRMTREEARRIVVNVMRLPDMLSASKPKDNEAG